MRGAVRGVAPFEGVGAAVHKSNLASWILKETPAQSLNPPTLALPVSDLWPHPAGFVSDLWPRSGVDAPFQGCSGRRSRRAAPTVGMKGDTAASAGAVNVDEVASDGLCRAPEKPR